MNRKSAMMHYGLRRKGCGQSCWLVLQANPHRKKKKKAGESNAIPFDIPEVDFTHYDDKCSFDYFVQKYEIDDPAIHTVAIIVRGADTDRHDLAAQSSGLWAISSGLAHISKSDYELVEKGMMIYDALYNWAKYHQKERHTQNPVEHLLIEVFEKYLKQQKSIKKIPGWAKELKEIIQDQIDTNITLKQLSKNLDINPAYLSREFSKYFDDLSFGEYIRKLRIEKAIEYLHIPGYSLTKIAYLTGFSDQTIATVRFTSGGALDTTWNSTGSTTQPLGALNFSCNGVTGNNYIFAYDTNTQTLGSVNVFQDINYY